MKQPIRFLVLFSILLHYFLPSYSQTAHQHETTKNCIICKTGNTHQIHDRPYKDFSFKSELPILIGIAGLTAVDLSVPSPSPLSIEQINLLDKSNVNSFDRYAISKNSADAQRISDIFLSGVLVLPAIFLSNHHTRKDVVPLAVMTIETVLFNLALTDLTKKIVRRTRPLAYNPNFSLEEKLKENTRASFFSGHTSHTAALSFLIAKVMTDYHPTARKGIKIGIWTFAATVPAVTGYLRVRAGKHFPTDTITGFVAGGLVGVLLPHLHRKKNNTVNKKITLIPAVGIGSAALTLHF